MTATLEFQNISKTFKSKKKSITALNEVSFSIREGEVFGFVGPNGAGKSTTIKIILDIIREYEGQVRIYGIDARKAEARKGVAYVPESPALYDNFTPLEILRNTLSVYEIQHNNKDRLCLDWLDKLSIPHTANQKIRLLSKGTVQRVALAHAMLISPKLLILDEPLSGLDPVGRKDVVNLLAEYKNQGGAIFFTSHVLYDVERIADRFGFINNGQLLTTRSPKDLVQTHKDRLLVRYRSNSQEITLGSQVRENEFEYETTQSELPRWIERLNQNNCIVLNITPAISLETVFFKILQESQTTHDINSDQSKPK